MDNNKPDQVVFEDATRESLIAISYIAPEKEQPDATHIHSNGYAIKENTLGAVEVDGDDKYRSQLISISYQSPEHPEPKPVHPGQK